METHFEAMQSSTHVSSEKIKEDLKTLMRDAEDLLKATAGDMSDRTAEVRSRLAQALEKAKGTYHHLEQNTVAAAKAADKAIRAHPYESLGIAFGVGLLIGVLVARK